MMMDPAARTTVSSMAIDRTTTTYATTTTYTTSSSGRKNRFVLQQMSRSYENEDYDDNDNEEEEEQKETNDAKGNMIHGQVPNDDPNNDNNKDYDITVPILYDDFGTMDQDNVAADDDDNDDNNDGVSTMITSLQTRIRQIQYQEQQQQQQIQWNWKQGNWMVRGFSLDPQPTTTTTTSSNLGGNKNRIRLDDDNDDNYDNDDNHDDIQSSKVIISSLLPWTNNNDDDDDNDDNDNDEWHKQQMEDVNRLLVGRTDGSICVVQLGTTYLTQFTNQLVAKKGQDDNTFTVTTQLTKQNRITDIINNNKDDDDDDDDDDDGQELTSASSSFEILAQFSASSYPIQHMLTYPIPFPDDDDDSDDYGDDDDHRSQLLFCSDAVTGDIYQWKLKDKNHDDTYKKKMTIQPLKKITWHTKPLLGLYHPPNHPKCMMVSVGQDQQIAIWNVSTAELIASFSVTDTNDVGNTDDSRTTGTILSCDVDDSYIYLGTTSGQVIIYSLQQNGITTWDKNRVATPLRTWTAHENAQVTAIASAGRGSLARNNTMKNNRQGGNQGNRHPSRSRSKTLLTASSDGVVKQWEILPRSSMENNNSDEKPTLEYWPKLKSQKLPNKVHLFDHQNKNTKVVALHSMDATKFCSATSDGQLWVWDPRTGNVLFQMAGFEFEQTTVTQSGETVSVHPSLCITRSMLISNGMEQYVCIHDFTASQELEDDYELEGEW